MKIKSLQFFVLLIAFCFQANAQIADGKSKFLGNIIKNTGTAPADFDTYWNQVSPENLGKWGIAETVRDVMEWDALDDMYQYAQDKNFPVKHHTFIWGQQQPSWLSGLSNAEIKAEVEEWFELYGNRYCANTQLIDVVNEPLHAKPSYRGAIGGSNDLYGTGWDWVVWSFEKAREVCPDAKLLLNDYDILKSNSATDDYLEIINILNNRGLIDGIGLQCHNLENTNTATIEANLNRLAATGLEIYISELDLNFSNDADQQARYEELFPVFWENDAVKGVTLWGYQENKIWRANAYLVREDGTERPALVWLRDYIQGIEPEPEPEPTGNLKIVAKGKAGGEILELRIDNSAVETWTLSSSWDTLYYDYSGEANVKVAFTNDQNTTRDMEVDFIELDGTKYETENMATNTAVWQSGSCGGSFSAVFHCNGYVDFGTLSSGSNPVLPSPFTYYNFDNDAVDSGTGGNDATLQNGAGYTSSGNFNQALNLDGVDDYATTPLLINPSGNDFSVTSWVKLTNSKGTLQAILQQEGSTGRTWLYRSTSDGKLCSFLGNKRTESTASLSLNAWHFVALVKNGNSLKLYINGSPDGSSTIAAESSSGAMRIGSHKSPNTNQEEWEGPIDDFRVYDQALTDDQILEIYNLTPSSGGRVLKDKVAEAMEVNDLENAFGLYPNPAKDFVNLKFRTQLKQNLEFGLFNLQGIKVWGKNMEASSGNNELVIPLNNFKNGMYVLHYQLDGQLINKKIIIEK